VIKNPLNLEVKREVSKQDNPLCVYSTAAPTCSDRRREKNFTIRRMFCGHDPLKSNSVQNPVGARLKSTINVRGYLCIWLGTTAIRY
jgi:hypothetical protein